MVFKNMHFHVHTFAVAGVIIVIAHSYVCTSAGMRVRQSVFDVDAGVAKNRHTLTIYVGVLFCQLLELQ